jgi:hypothetical protein
MSKVNRMRLAAIVARSRTMTQSCTILESLRGREHLRCLGMDNRIILKCNLKEQYMGILSVLIL